ncbi:MAG TPA: glycosyltransferase family 4 protein [Rhizomicrobium sp.]|nr:glycosyltransferase family 4 protein [Rhizomicrobium sp.]
MRATRNAKVALVANTSWYLYNFRRRLMSALRDTGYEVLAVAPEDAYTARLVSEGFEHHHIPLDATGLSPMRELQCTLRLRRLLRTQRVGTVFSFTPKGNIHCGFAITGPGVTFVPNISGLGRAFSGESSLIWLAKASFKRAFRRAATVFFQNNDDLRLLVDAGIVDGAKARRIPGSGVDLQRFSMNGCRVRAAGGPVFLFVARLLWEKGLGQYVAAARAIRARVPSARFQVLGWVQHDETGVPLRTIDQWVNEGAIEFLGASDDVREQMLAADCIVLPSYYREGVPRSLLEAAALEKPVVTCDVAGCRDAVDDNSTGYLCRPQDVGDLVAALEKFIALPQSEREEMGRRGRAKMEAEFDERFVIRQYLDVLSRAAA